MMRTKRRKLGGLAFAVASLLLCGAAMAESPMQEGPVQWDDEASQELEAALHEMHEAWNQGDLASLKKLLVGDDVLVTFELDPATHEPIRLDSREALWEFVDSIIATAEDEESETTLEYPRVSCRAADNFGICSEECSVTVELPDGVVERHTLWSTATAIRYPDGWRWIQWHMSSGGPVEVFQDGEQVASR